MKNLRELSLELELYQSERLDASHHEYMQLISNGVISRGNFPVQLGVACEQALGGGRCWGGGKGTFSPNPASPPAPERPPRACSKANLRVATCSERNLTWHSTIRLGARSSQKPDNPLPNGESLHHTATCV